MTKADIVNNISKGTGIDKEITRQVVESFMENVRKAVTGKRNVYLRGFGTFQVKCRAEKVARNISKQTSMTIPAHDIPSFKPSKTFIAKVKEKTE